MSFLSLHKSDYTIFCSVNSEVTGDVSTFTGDLGATSLANQNFTTAYFLTTKAFYTKALASVIVDILRGSTSFNM